MSAWILLIFMSTGEVLPVPGFADFDSCFVATQVVNNASTNLYPANAKRPLAATCVPAIHSAK